MGKAQYPREAQQPIIIIVIMLMYASMFQRHAGKYGTSGIYLFILCCISLGPQSVGVQCPITSSLGEFPGYWTGSDIHWLPPVLVSIAFPYAFSISVFYRSLFFILPLNFIRVSPLRLMCLHSEVVPSLVDGEFPGLGLGTQCCGPGGGALGADD